MHDRLHGNENEPPASSGALFRNMAEQAGVTILSCNMDEVVLLLQQWAKNDNTFQVTHDLLRFFPDLARIERAGEEWPHTAVSRALAGMAATGSVLLGERDHSDRLLTMLCRRHIILLPASQVYTDYPDIADLIRNLTQSGAASYLTMVTGPSRTADIEQLLTTGVHGPHELVVVVVKDWYPND